MDVFEGMGRGSVKRQRTSNEGGEMEMGGPGEGGAGVEGEGMLTTPPGSAVGVGVGPGGGGVVGKKVSRARSDSAPLGYAFGGLAAPSWQGNRPRSGSGIAGTRGVGSGMGMLMGRVVNGVMAGSGLGLGSAGAGSGSADVGGTRGSPGR